VRTTTSSSITPLLLSGARLRRRRHVIPMTVHRLFVILSFKMIKFIAKQRLLKARFSLLATLFTYRTPLVSYAIFIVL
jgi:hypothetical protein